MRDGGGRGMASLLRGEVRMWVRRSAILSPSRAHKNPLPLNQSLLPPSSLSPLSLGAVPHFQACMPLHAAN